MIEIDRRSASLKRRIHRLLGNRIELIWIRGCDLDPVIGEPEWIEQAILEMALRARAAMPYGGRLVVESCNLDLDELSAAAESLTAGRYVMFEMSCLRQTPTVDIDINVLPFSIEIDEDLWLNSQLTRALNILNAIGGTICEYNEPGRALTLRAFLPSAATVIYSDEEDSQLTQPAQPDNILLVEDEGYVREVACEILETAGYNVIVAKCGTEAIDVFAQHGPFSLLVTDVVMPGMNGRELATKLKSLQPDLKTIYMSGYTDSPLLRQDFQSSKYIYLQKPFTLESLTAKVKEVLASAVM
jgi:two-component system, cell cycle sensor histidine kinase and response regulator CckA